MRSQQSRVYSSRLSAARFVMAFALIVTSSDPGMSCDTWLAMWDVTSDGSTILAKNSDRPPFDCQPLVLHCRQYWNEGDVIKTGRLTIPQVTETYATIGSAPYWCWGYEEGMNEFGVAIGNEGIKTRVLARDLKAEEVGKGPMHGLTGMDLLRLGLERGRTASESLDVITTLLETYGQFGSGMPTQDVSEGGYDNSFIIADPNEAWVLETAGREWVARRITSGSASISNTPSIRTEWRLASAGVVSTAVQAGWWPGESTEKLDFLSAYDDDVSAAGKEWRGYALPRATCSNALLKKSEGRIDPPWMMRIGRDESSDPPINLDLSSVATASSCVAVLPRSKGDQLPVFWWCASVPKNSCYIPFFVHGKKLPAMVSNAGKQGRKIRPPSEVHADSYDKGSLWWMIRELNERATLANSAQQSELRKVFANLESDFAKELPEVMHRAIALMESNQEDQAASILDSFSQRCVDRVIDEAARLRDAMEDVNTSQ